jgi:CRISPR-associated protein Cas1
VVRLQALFTSRSPTEIGQLLGIEGAAAAVYFEHFQGMLKVDDANTGVPKQLAFSFDFTNRNRRPPRDPVNALLSLGYSLLAKDCTVAAYAVGLDPYVGLYHQPRFGRPALALDVMEEFRPLIVESTVLTLLNNRMLGLSDFVQAGQAVNSRMRHGRFSSRVTNRG